MSQSSVFAVFAFWWLLSIATPAFSQSATPVEIGAPKYSQNGNTVVIEIPWAESAKPEISRLHDPERLVLDFKNAVPKAGFQKIPIALDPVREMRSAIFQQNPSIARFVIELSSRADYDTWVSDGKFVVRINRGLKTAEPKNVSKPTGPVSLQPAVMRPAPSTSGQSRLNELEAISFHRESQGLQVDIKLTVSATPVLTTLENPSRIVLDFPQVNLAGEAARHPRISVNEAELNSIRTGQSDVKQNGARVVLDVPGQPQIPAIVGNGDTVSILLTRSEKGTTAAQTASPAMQSTASRAASSPAAPIPAERAIPSAPSSQKPPQGSTKPSQTARASIPALDPTVVRPQIEMTPANPDPSAVGIQPGKPVVNYTDGLLFIQAEHSTLADVLYEVGRQTGAKIDMPFSEGMLDRVVVKLGPGNPREILSAMLQGSAYQYIIVESATGLDKVILVPKP